MDENLRNLLLKLENISNNEGTYFLLFNSFKLGIQ
jgi:hypothetical protein